MEKMSGSKSKSKPEKLAGSQSNGPDLRAADSRIGSANRKGTNQGEASKLAFTKVSKDQI
jgi:hypothetical protein